MILGNSQGLPRFAKKEAGISKILMMAYLCNQVSGRIALPETGALRNQTNYQTLITFYHEKPILQIGVTRHPRARPP